VLFLCTGNSARSQMGEALLRHMSRGKVEVFSAGSHPRPEIHPLARRAVRELYGLDMAGQRPKQLEEFLGDRFDYVITVCDRAAESCPALPGDPERIRWSFERTARDLAGRIRLWMSLPAVGSRMRAESDARVL
jgi:protein-tyrosine-phosphatase